MEQQLADIYSALTSGDTQAMQQIGWMAFLFLMGVSLSSALGIAYLYRQFYGTRATGSRMHRTFPVLGISVTAIFICIQFSLPLSLGLLGALSIVRFRTPIKEPEEIGFIMLVIASSIACATFNITFLGIIFIVAILALLAQTFRRVLQSTLHDGLVVISMPTACYTASAEAVGRAVTKQVGKARLESVSRDDAQTVVSYNFRSVSKPGMRTLHAELGRIVNDSTVDVFFNRPGVT